MLLVHTTTQPRSIRLIPPVGCVRYHHVFGYNDNEYDLDVGDEGRTSLHQVPGDQLLVLNRPGYKYLSKF